MTNKVDIPVQCKERNDVLVERITAGAPNNLNIKYGCAVLT
jgi:hypothetical protein